MRANVRVWMTIGALSAATGIAAQNQQPPGHPIGTVTTRGELIVLELDAGAIAPANLFDLARRTLRFTPDGNGYRVENVAVQWDADFGTQITSPIVPLRNFTFPFSGKSWDSIAVGQTGTISFGVAPSGAPGGRGGSGPAVGRFAELRRGHDRQHAASHQRVSQASRPGSFCSDGRLQSTFIQPVYVGSNQGLERSPDGSMTGYNLAMSQIGHELGHRWMAFGNATVNGETFPLGPTHWARGLQAPAAYPYRRPVEASAMGGGVWQQNDDGTYTQLDDDVYVPANGYSYLDLYFMVLVPASEVPDFFILRNLVLVGKDPKGLAIYRGERTTITIQDVIAANGPRTPSYETSQKQFNTGIVIVVLKGKAPSPELVERANGIRQTWIDYWAKTTSGRSTMTTKPKE
jgi:hypothetical protein